MQRGMGMIFSIMPLLTVSSSRFAAHLHRHQNQVLRPRPQLRNHNIGARTAAPVPHSPIRNRQSTAYRWPNGQ